MLLDIPDDLMPLLRFDAHERLVNSQNQFYLLERQHGLGHESTLRAKVLYDQAQQIVAIVDPPKQVSAA